MNNEEKILELMTKLTESVTLIANKLDILINESFKSRQHGGGQPQQQPQQQNQGQRQQQQGQRQQQQQGQRQQQRQEQRHEQHHEQHLEQQPQQQKKHGKQMYKVVCADCRNECEIPFQPKDDRPVYCNDCFAARKAAGRTFKPTTPSEMPKAKDVTPQDQNKVVMIDWRNEGSKTVVVNEAAPEEVVNPVEQEDSKPAEKKRPNGRPRPAAKKKVDLKRKPAPKKRR